MVLEESKKERTSDRENKIKIKGNAIVTIKN